MATNSTLLTTAENKNYSVDLIKSDIEHQYVHITDHATRSILPINLDENNYTDISLQNYNHDILLLLNELGDLDYINLTERPLKTRVWSKAPVTYWGDKNTSIGV